MPHQLGGERIIVGEKGRQIGAERDACGAGQRREVGDEFGLVLVGERQRIGKDEAALGIGIADLDGDALARGINIARTKARAGDRVLHRRNEHAQPNFSPRAMIMDASASAVAAPPMSFFILSMPVSGLMSRPPVSKQTPLPTSVTRG